MRVSHDHPVLVDVRGPSPNSAVVLNNGPATVYYGSTESVSSTSNDGSLALGATVTLSSPAYFVTGPPPANGGQPFVADIEVQQVETSPQTAQSGSGVPIMQGDIATNLGTTATVTASGADARALTGTLDDDLAITWGGGAEGALLYFEAVQDGSGGHTVSLNAEDVPINTAADAPVSFIATWLPDDSVFVSALGVGSTTAADISVTPAGSMASTNVQDALEEAFSELGGGGGGTPSAIIAWTPDVTLSENFPRYTAVGDLTLESGRAYGSGYHYLQAGAIVEEITFLSGGTALATATHQWAALMDTDTGDILGLSADATSDAWADNTFKTFTLASPYTLTEAKRLTAVICVVAGTMISLRTSTANSRAELFALAPVPSWRSNSTSYTNPASLTDPYTDTDASSMTTMIYSQLRGS